MPTTNDISSVTVDKLPYCDLCLAWKPIGSRDVLAHYDARMKNSGTWAFMCEEHFLSHGVGLGLGRGQRLVVAEPTTP